MSFHIRIGRRRKQHALDVKLLASLRLPSMEVWSSSGGGDLCVFDDRETFLGVFASEWQPILSGKVKSDDNGDQLRRSTA